MPAGRPVLHAVGEPGSGRAIAFGGGLHPVGGGPAQEGGDRCRSSGPAGEDEVLGDGRGIDLGVGSGGLVVRHRGRQPEQAPEAAVDGLGHELAQPRVAGLDLSHPHQGRSGR